MVDEIASKTMHKDQNYFISFPSEKHAFITVGIVFVWYIFTLAVINRSILLCDLLSTRK